MLGPAAEALMLAGFYSAPLSLLGGPQQDALPDSEFPMLDTSALTIYSENYFDISNGAAEGSRIIWVNVKQN